MSRSAREPAGSGGGTAEAGRAEVRGFRGGGVAGEDLFVRRRFLCRDGVELRIVGGGRRSGAVGSGRCGERFGGLRGRAAENCVVALRDGREFGSAGEGIGGGGGVSVFENGAIHVSRARIGGIEQ